MTEETIAIFTKFSDNIVTIILAIIAVAGSGAAWRFWNRRAKLKHEEEMKKLELEAETAKKKLKADNLKEKVRTVKKTKS